MQNETNTYFFLEIRPNISTTGMEKQVYKLFLLVPVIFNTGIYNIRMKCRKKRQTIFISLDLFLYKFSTVKAFAMAFPG